MKKFNRRQFIGSIPALAMVSCYSSQKPDIILHNANIITVNTIQPKAEEIGKLADLVILEKDPRKTDPMSIIDIPIQRTMVGGNWSYES